MRTPLSILFVAVHLTVCHSLVAEDLCSIADRAMITAKKIRGLNPKKPVPCHARDKKKIKKYVVEAVTTETPRERIIGEGVLYEALGIVPEKFNYEKEIVDLYTSQIGGYYDPKRNHFVMAAWMPATLQYPVAVHELVHALQDQHFNLDSFMDIKKMSSDELMARSALVEGDATAVMIDHSIRQTGQGTIFDRKDVGLFLAQNVIGAQMLGSANPKTQSLMQLIIFPYSSGFRFAHEVAKKSKSYDALDAVFKNPPRSTEEILHPEKYGSEKPDFVNPEITGLAEEPYHQDTLGEFFLSVWLSSQGVPGVEAAKAAAGWGGDRAVVLKKSDSKYQVLWHIRFDSEEDVKEFKAALTTADTAKSVFNCSELLCKNSFDLTRE